MSVLISGSVMSTTVIMMAKISSYKDVPMDEHTVFFGEVGLSGEVRGISMAAQCVQEAKKLGFKRCVLPKVNLSSVQIDGIELIGISDLHGLLRVFK